MPRTNNGEPENLYSAIPGLWARDGLVKRSIKVRRAAAGDECPARVCFPGARVRPRPRKATRALAMRVHGQGGGCCSLTHLMRKLRAGAQSALANAEKGLRRPRDAQQLPARHCDALTPRAGCAGRCTRDAPSLPASRVEATCVASQDPACPEARHPHARRF